MATKQTAMAGRVLVAPSILLLSDGMIAPPMTLFPGWSSRKHRMPGLTFGALKWALSQ